MTMRSPAEMPEVTTTRSPSREPTVTSRCDTVLFAASTTQTKALPSFSSSAVAGRSTCGATGRLNVTETVAPRRKTSGGSFRVR